MSANIEITLVLTDSGAADLASFLIRGLVKEMSVSVDSEEFLTLLARELIRAVDSEDFWVRRFVTSSATSGNV